MQPTTEGAEEKGPSDVGMDVVLRKAPSIPR